MTKTKNLRNENDDANEIRNAEGSARRKRLSWMRKISISLERQTLNGSGRLHHRYAHLSIWYRTPVDRLAAKTQAP
jgi:hypothetical protein